MDHIDIFFFLRRCEIPQSHFHNSPSSSQQTGLNPGPRIFGSVDHRENPSSLTSVLEHEASLVAGAEWYRSGKGTSDGRCERKEHWYSWKCLVTVRLTPSVGSHEQCCGFLVDEQQTVSSVESHGILEHLRDRRSAGWPAHHHPQHMEKNKSQRSEMDLFTVWW